MLHKNNVFFCLFHTNSYFVTPDIIFLVTKPNILFSQIQHYNILIRKTHIPLSFLAKLNLFSSLVLMSLHWFPAAKFLASDFLHILFQWEVAQFTGHILFWCCKTSFKFGLFSCWGIGSCWFCLSNLEFNGTRTKLIYIFFKF